MSAEEELKQTLEKSAALVNSVAAHLTEMANAAEVPLDSHVVVLALGLLFAGHAKFTGLTVDQCKIIVELYYNLANRLYLPIGGGSSSVN